MDRTRQVNSSSNNQNQISPSLSNEGLHSSSSLIAGSGQRFPDRLSELSINLSPQETSANIVPNNGFNACVSLHESTIGMGLNIHSSSNSLTRSPQRLPNSIHGSIFHYQGNLDSSTQTRDSEMNPDINLELSLSSHSHPYESSPYQFGTNSTRLINADNHNRAPRYVVEEEREDGSITTNPVRLPFKRSYTDYGREFHVGESSSMGSQVEIAKRHAATTSHDNVINTSPLRIDPTPANNQPIGFGGATSVSEIQAGQSESNTNMQIIPATTVEEAFVRPNPNRFSSSYTRGQQIHLLDHAPLGFQLEHPPFFTPLENSNDASSSRQPTEINTPSFLRVISASPPITNTNTRNPFPVTIIDTSQIRSEDMESLHTRLGEIRQISMQRSEIHDGENDGQPPPITSIGEMRNNMEARAQVAMERLRSGQVLQVQDMMALNHSLAIRMIEAQVAAAVGEVEDIELSMILGLPEELIMKYIKLEKFVLGDKKTEEVCCICQEEYVNGVEVGKLDCEHIFHIECIKEWLKQKNECPICRKKALTLE